jgi:hypothetical protein
VRAFPTVFLSVLKQLTKKINSKWTCDRFNNISQLPSIKTTSNREINVDNDYETSHDVMEKYFIAICDFCKTKSNWNQILHSQFFTYPHLNTTKTTYLAFTYRTRAKFAKCKELKRNSAPTWHRIHLQQQQQLQQQQ